jgi:hypothetical protein
MKPGRKHKVGVYSGPEIINDGLVLSLDAANSKGFDKYENLITHSSMSGWTVGVLGSGGSLPTGWVLDQLQPGSAITIIGGGTENGLNYVDIRFSATSVSTTNRTLIRPGNSVTTDGSTYYLTTYSKLVSGSSTNLTHINFHTGALSLTSTLTRNVGASAVLSGTFFPRYDIGYNGTGVAYDITIRFAAPQLEKGSSATDYYATTGTAKTRGTTWTDLTGNVNTGTLTNGPTYSSANGGSIVFDGTNDYVTSSFATTSGQAVTYTGWLYSTETTATYRNFVDSVTARPMIWWNASGQIEFDAAYYTTTAVYRNQWVYVALSKPSGSSSASYYVNGVLVGSGTAYTTSAVTPTWFNRAAAQTWKGNAAQVQVYNRALTASEIQQNYNATKSRFGL